MPDEQRYFFDSPAGRILLRFDGEILIGVDFGDAAGVADCPPLPPSDARRWLEAYFAGRDPGPLPRHEMGGSKFQRRVWTEMLRIPRGQTLSYGELAQRIGSAPRAVGQACKRNHLPLFIPCHRVVAASSLGGYSGARDGHQLDRKRWLLHHEAAV